MDKERSIRWWRAKKLFKELQRICRDSRKRILQKILSDYNQLRQEYFSSIDNIDLYLEIEELTARDQFVRKTGMYLDGFSEIDYQKAGDQYRLAIRENDSIKAKKFKKFYFIKQKTSIRKQLLSL